ncbi:polysaccharide deacetylase [Sphingobacterium spiritivorum ATCC 33300]|uniref:Polysaccharide deacetylase n=1 Tax=Sphingobacterium spiritivorum ATCC 33300 TaxID=525372 RepID=C2FS31_SPHSI|nr:glycoside hydrolase family 9 protein [Sphingobacterium spiritivorum]EEI94396.1 polysaccharide deacetylase [Sphingobacterium spiritivorum ATCC 33300]QQS98017.1 glycoside hydrolase family 9 protein [Sphingobacterium spiritivorum]
MTLTHKHKQKIMQIAMLFCAVLCFNLAKSQEKSWIRINQIGYTPQAVKVAVWVSKEQSVPHKFELINVRTQKTVFKNSTGKNFGAYGPFLHSLRLDFSVFREEGEYYIKAGKAVSPTFKINKNVYKGTADFALRYMRQQRTLFNPFLQDSCHTHDGFTMYAGKAGLPDSTQIDAGGGWHDASDYLQYSTTSANATYHLLAAYRDFPHVFEDTKQANGLVGKNGIADVLDEAKWGLDWLLKMHPQPHLMFNQIADDRDHTNMRIPKEDPFYGRGFERPVYFIDGEPQQRGKFMNNTTGTSSTAAKFSSAFTLGSTLFQSVDPGYSGALQDKAKSALEYAYIKPGVTQTVSVKSPYIYAEDNWVDDMELASALMFSKTGDQTYARKALDFAEQEKVTPWMIRDTASHYQYYPFINLGHYELAKSLKGDEQKQVIAFYKEGIDEVWSRAKENAFYRGVPFIWCSNNLTVSFAIQCKWYRDISKDSSYAALEQANIDWLFGVNPWGTSMVYGLPADGDTPVDPHSAFTKIGNYPIDGGLVDGPVYSSIFNNLIGIKLNEEDEYAEFQSELAVYHDDYGDYSTNEPTMDGTASLVYLLAAQEEDSHHVVKDNYGAIIKGDPAKKNISLVFTADEFYDGATSILETLKKEKVQGSFFVTGRFLDNPNTDGITKEIVKRGHYLAPHSDQHLLYCDWEDRQHTRVSKEEFTQDLNNNFQKMKKYGVKRDVARYFLPSYEWYNADIVSWAGQEGIQVVNFTPGLRTAADYTYPELGNRYLDSETIYNQLIEKEQKEGLNGYIILVHLGTDPKRKDKFYTLLPRLIKELRKKDYHFKVINDML